MSAVGSILQNEARFYIDGDISTDKGMLGQTLIVNTANNFSINPLVGNLLGTQNRYYHTYLVNASANISIVMPDVSLLNNGWRTRIQNNSAANVISILNFAGVLIAVLQIGFMAELLLNTTWKITYQIPTIPSSINLGKIISYNANGYPKIDTLPKGMFTASLSGNKPITTNATINNLIWSSNLKFDSDYYVPDITPAAPAIILRVVGIYHISMFVGILGDGTPGQEFSNVVIGPISGGNIPFQYSLSKIGEAYQDIDFGIKSEYILRTTIINQAFVSVSYTKVPLIGTAFTTNGPDPTKKCSWIKVTYLGSI